jgi:hypothetical protein
VYYDMDGGALLRLAEGAPGRPIRVVGRWTEDTTTFLFQCFHLRSYVCGPGRVVLASLSMLTCHTSPAGSVQR